MRYELNTGWEFAVVDSHAQNGSADPVDFKKLTFLPATVPGVRNWICSLPGVEKTRTSGRIPTTTAIWKGKISYTGSNLRRIPTWIGSALRESIRLRIFS